MAKKFSIDAFFSDDAKAILEWERQAIEEALEDAHTFGPDKIPLDELCQEIVSFRNAGFVPYSYLSSAIINSFKQGPGADLHKTSYLLYREHILKPIAEKNVAERMSDPEYHIKLHEKEIQALSIEAYMAIASGSKDETYAQELRQVMLAYEIGDL